VLIHGGCFQGVSMDVTVSVRSDDQVRCNVRLSVSSVSSGHTESTSIGTSLVKVPIYPCLLDLQYSEWPPLIRRSRKHQLGSRLSVFVAVIP